MSITRSTVGAKLHDDFADGDATSNPTWTSETGTMSVTSQEFNPAAAGANGWARSAVTINNSDLISWRAKVVTGNFADDLHRVEIGDSGRTNFYDWVIRAGVNQASVSKRVASADTTLLTFTENINTATFHTYAIKWNGSSLRFYIDDAEITGAAATDSAFSTHAFIRLMSLGGVGGGTNRVTFDDICVMDGWTVVCSGLPTGYKLRVISDAGGTAVATATEVSGTATVDLTGKCAFPYYGVQVLDASSVVQDTLVPSATVSGHTASGVFGGDVFAYTPGGGPAPSMAMIL